MSLSLTYRVFILLSPYTLEEVVARNYILQEKPDAIINIVDGTNIERNLYLTTQILELGIPVIMAVNMMDIVEKNGDTIHIDKLKKKLGCEVVDYFSSERNRNHRSSKQSSFYCTEQEESEHLFMNSAIKQKRSSAQLKIN